MKKLLGLLLIALPAWSHAAQTREVTAFYANLQGDWQIKDNTDRDSERYKVSYTLNSQGLHVQGTECNKVERYGDCYFIEADYVLPERGSVQRIYPAYGAQEVRIESVSPSELVRREYNPLDAKSYLIVRERLMDAYTLMVVREVWRVGRDGAPDQKMSPDDVVVLQRAGEPTGITSANTDAGGVLQ